MTAAGIQENADLSARNTFGVPASAAYCAEITDLDTLQAAIGFAQQQHLPMLILGGGSNCLFLGHYSGLVLRVANKGYTWDEHKRQVTVAAGENWHELVSQCVSKGYFGCENLALIPGSVGAAPIQNIGAYGVELADIFVELEAIDLITGEHHCFDKAACDFGYRDSFFKTAQDTQWLIWSVTLQLRAEDTPNIDYGALREALAGQGEAPVTAQRVFDTVCAVRRSKLPDPAELGNAGSFFKNPVVSSSKLESLQVDYPQLPHFATEDRNLVKIPAAWLLQEAGWKGRRRGDAGVHAEHALVLVNHGNASGEDLYLLAQEMSASVLEKFGIALQPEVRLITG